MNEELLDEIGQMAEQLDNALFAHKTMTKIPAEIHLKGLSGTIKQVRDELARIYKENGGDEELNLQA